MKLGLVFIVGTANDETVRMLESVKKVKFDTISAVMTKDSPLVESTLKKYGCKITKLEEFWNDDFTNWDFGAARNISLENCDADVIMFLDTDDVVIHPENIRPLVKKHIQNSKADCLLVYYDYQQDEKGNTTNTYFRERIFVKKHFKWVGMANCYAASTKLDKDGQNLCKYVEIPQEDLLIKHNMVHGIDRKKRHTTIIEREYKVAKTPRVVYYCGRNHMFDGNYKKARKYFNEFLKMKDASVEEKYCALMSMYKMTDKVDEMKRYSEEAMNLNPGWSEAYFKLAFVQLLRGDYTNCVANSKMGFDLDKPVPGQPYNKLEFTLMPTRVMHAALEALGEQESADKVRDYALAEFPDDEYLKSKLNKEK